MLDRTNVRQLTTELIDGQVSLVVGDLSFISLTLVLPALSDITEPDGDLVLMVKPQFEVGKDRLGKGGVVRDRTLWVEAVEGVVAAAADLGWRCAAVTTSQLPGPAGNVEFFVWLSRTATHTDPAWRRDLVLAAARSGVPGESVTS